MAVTRSTDGGLTWQKPVTLIKDTNPHVLDDKNSITADPNNPSIAYAVWDRLQGLLADEEHGDGGKAAAERQYDGVIITEQHARAALAGKSSLQKPGAATPAAGDYRPKARPCSRAPRTAAGPGPRPGSSTTRACSSRLSATRSSSRRPAR